MDSLEHRRCWYPAFVIYRWRHVLWMVPLLSLLGLLALHWNRLRWDHAMAVVLLRPTGLCVFGGPPPVRSGETTLKVSPAVLRKTARDTGLAASWQMDETQAAERLQALVICDSVPGTATVEVKVRKIPSADPIKVCEILVRHADQEMAVERLARNTAEINRWKAEAGKIRSELEVIRAQLSGGIRASQLPSRDPSELMDELHANHRRLEEINIKIISDEMDLRVLESPTATVLGPHWPGRPSTHRLQHFGISAAWTFGISVLIAVAIAYLLEAMIPRKQALEAQAP